MLSVILQIAVFASLVAMIAIFVRAVPRVSDESLARAPTLEQWLESLPLSRIDAFLRRLMHKGLRKTRLVILRVDNSLGLYLDRVKEEENGSLNGKPRLDVAALRQSSRRHRSSR